MKNKMVWTVLILFIVILISQVFSQNKPISKNLEVKKETWEYKYFVPTTNTSKSLDEGISEMEMNKLGKEGWELAIVQPATRTSEMKFVFKRRKQ